MAYSSFVWAEHRSNRSYLSWIVADVVGLVLDRVNQGTKECGSLITNSRTVIYAHRRDDGTMILLQNIPLEGLDSTYLEYSPSGDLQPVRQWFDFWIDPLTMYLSDGGFTYCDRSGQTDYHWHNRRSIPKDGWEPTKNRIYHFRVTSNNTGMPYSFIDRLKAFPNQQINAINEEDQVADGRWYFHRNVPRKIPFTNCQARITDSYFAGNTLYYQVGGNCYQWDTRTENVIPIPALPNRLRAPFSDLFRYRKNSREYLAKRTALPDGSYQFTFYE